MKNYWVCIVGPVESDELPDGADWPPRHAAQEAIEKMTNHEFKCWSGWGCDVQMFDDIMSVWNRAEK